MNIKNNNYGNLDRGVATVIPVSVIGADGAPINIEDQKIYFTVKPEKYDFDRADNHAIIVKSFVPLNAKEGKFLIELSAKDMDFAPGKYYADIMIGNWRAANFEFSLIGGPTNRHVLENNTDQLCGLGAGLTVLYRENKSITIVTPNTPYIEYLQTEIKGLQETVNQIFEPAVKKVKITPYESYNYLYEAAYDNLDYAGIDKYIDDIVVEPAGCSSMRYDKYHCRKYDWYYNHSATVFVRVPSIKGKHKSMGIAALKGVTKGAIENNAMTAEQKKCLPFLLLDGINDCGVCGNINVTPTYYGAEDTTPEGTVTATVNALTLIRWIVDNYSSAEEAVNDIVEHVSITLPPKMVELGYSFHYMISDEDNTYILELINGKNVVMSVNDPESNIYHAPYMTNFNLYNVVLNSNKTVYTPRTQDETHNAIITNQIEPNGSGLERYNILATSQKGDIDKLTQIMQSIDFTHAYPSAPGADENNIWYTEAAGLRDLTVASSVSEYAPVIDEMDRLYLERSRETGKTWQTVHTAIYDLHDKKVTLYIQEQDYPITFSL